MDYQGLVYDGGKNKFIDLKEAFVPILDLAVTRGVGIIEVLRTYHHKPFALDEHLERLGSSEKIIGLNLRYSKEFIKKKVLAGLARFKKEAVIKILVTGGPSRHLSIEGPPGLFIVFMPVPHYPPWQYERGTRLQSVMHSRILPGAKSTNYLFAIWAHHLVAKRGFDEVVYKDGRGDIYEGTSFNFAVVKNKTLITPQKGVLRGITMEATVRLARKLGMKVERRPIRYRELQSADEAFTASTLREVVPAVRIDRIRIGKGKPGKWTRLLLAEFRKHIQIS